MTKVKNPNRVASGRQAKYDGHAKEKTLAQLRTEETGVQYYTDGKKNTKVDVYAGDRRNPIEPFKYPHTTNLK